MGEKAMCQSPFNNRRKEHQPPQNRGGRRRPEPSVVVLGAHMSTWKLPEGGFVEKRGKKKTDITPGSHECQTPTKFMPGKRVRGKEKEEKGAWKRKKKSRIWSGPKKGEHNWRRASSWKGKKKAGQSMQAPIVRERKMA